MPKTLAETGWKPPMIGRSYQALVRELAGRKNIHVSSMLEHMISVAFDVISKDGNPSKRKAA